MKTTKIVLYLLSGVFLLLSGCAAQSEEPDISVYESPVMLSIANIAPRSIDNGQNIQLGFNLELLKELSKKQKNIFYSSFSINQALTMAYFGADGATQDEIKNVLGYNDLSVEDIAAYQKYLLKTYKNSGDTTFYSANSMWIDDEIIIKENYMDTMADNFEAEIENIDLQSGKAVSTLNKWIDKKTKGMITELFEDPFDPLTRVVLMNAIYFNGNWTTPFDPDSTRDMAFNGTSQQSTAEMMYSDEEVLGYEGDGYKAVDMPYGDDERFQMVAVLPDGDINEFIQSQTTDSLNNILTTFEEKDEAIILFPKFEMEEKIELNDTLKALGIQTAFTDEADFNEISDTDLYINKVLHKAKIKVDEEGTEAAAVTAVVLNGRAMPGDIFRFTADKPFIFFIMDTKNDTVLFTGVVYDLQ